MSLAEIVAIVALFGSLLYIFYFDYKDLQAE